MAEEMKSRIYLKIPLERTGVLIGNKGSTKAEIEKSTGTNICVDGKTGEVVIEGSPNYKDPSGILKAKDLINAIARGFSPERAFRLFSDGQILDVIDLKEILGDSRNQLIRVKGRVIGEKGKTRRIIENLTNTYISIYGHTIAIIGDYEEVRVAKEAIEMLLKGMQHGTVYRFLNRKHMDLKKRELSLWEEKPQLREEA